MKQENDDFEEFADQAEDKKAPKQPFDLILAAIFDADEVSLPALFRLSDMGQQEFTQFSQQWEQVDEARRGVVARHMADLSEQNFEVEFAPAFKQMLRDSTVSVRLAALDGLWDTTAVTVIPTIINVLQDDTAADVRTSAAATLAHVILLGEWGQISARLRDNAADALVAAYQNAENPATVRRAALESLGASSHEQVPTMIAEAYESSDPQMLVSALFAMGNSADLVWLGTISAEMENPITSIRAEAARAAGELGSGDMVADLAELVFDVEEDVQTAAIIALGKIGSDQAIELLAEFSKDDDIADLHSVIKQAMVSETDSFTEEMLDDEWDDDDDAWDDDQAWSEPDA